MTATDDNRTEQARHATQAAPVRVALVADDEVTTRGLAAILREHNERFELVTIASRDQAPVDIALYDPVLGGRSRPDRLSKLLSDPHVRKVAVFTSSFAPSLAIDFTGQGACAYLSKSMSSGEIVDALTKASRGEVVVPVGASRDRSRQGPSASHGDVLTPRETDVLAHIARGLSNTDIALTLGVSVNSVKSYIRACYRKIGVNSRSKAVLWALNNGLGGATHG